MRVMNPKGGDWRRRSPQAFSLAEVLVCVVVSLVMFAGVLLGFVQSSYRAEWSGYSLAAQAQAIQAMELARSAKWDVNDNPPVNELTNMVLTNVALLDMPVNGTNRVYATNFVSLALITNGTSMYYKVRVDTVWPFTWKTTRVYTNTVIDYFAQD